MIIAKAFKATMSIVIMAGTEIVVDGIVKKNMPETANAVVKAVVGIAGVWAGAMLADQVCDYMSKETDKTIKMLTDLEKATNKGEVKDDGAIPVKP